MLDHLPGWPPDTVTLLAMNPWNVELNGLMALGIKHSEMVRGISTNPSKEVYESARAVKMANIAFLSGNRSSTNWAEELAAGV